ncbi:hypothetical protein ACOXXX_03900 [Thalassococcus sp. BH17M4-6]|uniref:hypothetical protein n=1 Tax=Thalassococcus sp. BH17M4-6 TaxID=3413148 RepID=UPI003BBFEB95
MSQTRGTTVLILGFFGLAVLVIAAKFGAGWIMGPTALERCLASGGTWDSRAQGCQPP